MIDPAVALRAAVASAFDVLGLGDFDDGLVEDFLLALKDHGYIVIREANGVFFGTQKE
jgi:hypothetical protein